jgi:hypothetical protein
MRSPVVACLGLLILSAGCAPTTESADGAPPRARQCFTVQQVSNFRQGRPDQLFLRVGRSDVYELNAAGGCNDLNFANRLALVSDFGAGGTRLCTDDWARVIVPGTTQSMASCRVRVSRKLTDEDIAALPAAHRP